MKAYLCSGFGGPEVLKLDDVPTPEPGLHDILIKVHATTVSSADWRIMSRSLPPGFGLLAPLVVGAGKPRNPILGVECAGVVDSVGAQVAAFRVGDRVVAYPGGAMGAHAEYLLMPDSGALARIPDPMPFTEAAALAFGGVTALGFLDTLGKVQPGESVLIIGASGCVGSAGVQLARHLGAEVTGVCSTANLDLVRGLGADHVIDYRQDDFRTQDKRYDVIFDTVGQSSPRALRDVLTDAGRVLVATPGLGTLLASAFSGGRLRTADIKESAATLARIVEIAGSGGFSPVIEQVFPFSALPEAMARVASHRKRGNLVIELGGSSS